MFKLDLGSKDKEDEKEETKEEEEEKKSAPPSPRTARSEFSEIKTDTAAPDTARTDTDISRAPDSARSEASKASESAPDSARSERSEDSRSYSYSESESKYSEDFSTSSSTASSASTVTHSISRRSVSKKSEATKSKSRALSEKQKESIETDEDISEHFSDGDESGEESAMFDLNKKLAAAEQEEGAAATSVEQDKSSQLDLQLSGAAEDVSAGPAEQKEQPPAAGIVKWLSFPSISILYPKDLFISYFSHDNDWKYNYNSVLIFLHTKPICEKKITDT